MFQTTNQIKSRLLVFFWGDGIGCLYPKNRTESFSSTLRGWNTRDFASWGCAVHASCAMDFACILLYCSQTIEIAPKARPKVRRKHVLIASSDKHLFFQERNLNTPLGPVECCELSSAGLIGIMCVLSATKTPSSTAGWSLSTNSPVLGICCRVNLRMPALRRPGGGSWCSW